MGRFFEVGSRNAEGGRIESERLRRWEGEKERAEDRRQMTEESIGRTDLSDFI